MFKPIINPIKKLTQTFRRQSLLERRQKQVENLIQQRQMKGLPTKAEELHKENIKKESENLKSDIAGKISSLNKNES